MATSAPRKNENERRAASSHHSHQDRNRTFSSTTTNHYKNKLAQIGIQKDLRELIDKKKFEKEQEMQNNSSGAVISNELPQISRKVRFTEGKAPVRRSKSFTSGTNENHQHNIQTLQGHIKEKSPQRKSNKNVKGKRKDYVDLQNPTNIKIELQTGSGERKCILDDNVALARVKCDLRSCRTILGNSENKTIVRELSPDKNKDKFKSYNFVRGRDQSRSFNRKHKNYAEKYTPNENYESVTSNNVLIQEKN